MTPATPYQAVVFDWKMNSLYPMPALEFWLASAEKPGSCVWVSAVVARVGRKLVPVSVSK